MTGWRCFSGCGSTVCLVLLLLGGCGGDDQKDARTGGADRSGQPARYVGRTTCTDGCHAKEAGRWLGSHHDLAMQPARPETVLGDFEDATFSTFGVTSTFFRRGDEYWVRTDGADGELREYRVVYTFGVVPLQQYLVETERGRLQALPICWDTRTADKGGQRWFHLYPDEKIDHRDLLHWTGPYMNWNYMCADCHSTAVKKGYDTASDSYDTTWAEIDVSCEACHGPGSRHVAWARTDPAVRSTEGSPGNHGLVVDLRDLDGGFWAFEPVSDEEGAKLAAIARRTVPRRRHREVETCARCHARRSPIHAPYQHGRPLLDSYRPATLDAPLYFDDGQILDEVYVYGSFLESRMFREGVTCKDCHDPHSAAVWGSPESVCGRCHLAQVFDTPEHHHHRLGSTGARCVECHMAARTYMVIDPRRDHSFRVPRPDLTVEIGVPNACNGCHRDREPAWAAAAVERWFPNGRSGTAHWGQALHAARATAADSERRLENVVGDPEVPAIARATALAELRRFLSPLSLPAVEQSLRDPDPLVRLAAVTALDGADEQTRVRLVLPLVEDEVRGVRLEAARVLSPVPAEALGSDGAQRLAVSLDEYRAAQLVNADRADAHLNLGALAAARGDTASARAAYETALRLQPGYTPAALNLADLERQVGRGEEAVSILRAALEQSPDDARIHHALGLALVRMGRHDEALGSFRLAAELDPGEPRYAYVYGVALHDLGRLAESRGVLLRNHARHPGDRDTLSALVSYSQDEGDAESALRFARRLAELVPGDAGLRELVADLERR